MMPWNEKHWTVDSKPPKELRAFDGDIKNFDKWRLRVRYHIISTNMSYKDIFDIIEKTKSIVSFSALAVTRVHHLPNVNWIWSANHLWGFIGKVLNDTMLGRMQTMAQGEEFNGIELLRAIYLEFMGGSVEMNVTERGFFIDYPTCSKDEDLQNHITYYWNRLKLQYGQGLPDDHLKHMFRNILPEHVKAELKKQNLDSLDKEYNWVHNELGRFNDHRLSKWNIEKLTEQIRTRNPVRAHHVGAEQVAAPAKDDVPAPPVPDMSSMQANIERMVAAAISRNDRGRSETRNSQIGSRSGSTDSKKGRYRSLPNPKFKGCWCCGEEGHSRQNCPVSEKVRKANGGKVPRNYEGAYEKAMKKGKVVAVISAQEETSPIVGQGEDAEHSETYVPLWPLMRSPPPAPTSIHKKLLALDDNNGEIDDDESEVVKALSMLTPNVRRADGLTQSQRRNNGKLNMARITALAKQVKSGEIHCRISCLIAMRNITAYGRLWTQALVSTAHRRSNSRMLYLSRLRRFSSQQRGGDCFLTAVP